MLMQSYRCKTIILLAVVACFLVPGCAKKQETPFIMNENLPNGFSATVTFTVSGVTAVADIERSASETLSLTLTEPKSLYGISFILDKETAKASYKGMELDLGSDGLITKLAISSMLKAVNAVLEQKNIKAQRVENAIVVSGTKENMDFTATLDPKTGMLVSLSIPNLDLNASFIT